MPERTAPAPASNADEVPWLESVPTSEVNLGRSYCLPHVISVDGFPNSISSAG